MRDLPATMSPAATAWTGSVAEEPWFLAVVTTRGPVVTMPPVRSARPLSTCEARARALLVPTACALLMATLSIHVLNRCTALADGMDPKVPRSLLPEVPRGSRPVSPSGDFELVVERVAG